MSDIQIIIRVHDTNRPLQRAIASVLSYEKASVLIVAHGIPASSIPVPESDRITFAEAPSGWGFPGVSSNAGVQAATADFIGLLDSDDYFEPGALEALHKRFLEDNADGVIIPRRTEGKQRSLLPVTLRTKKLRADKDRLFYYTAPFGLYKREVLQNPALAFDETVRTGEDIGTSGLLWTGGLNVSHYPGDPAYVVTDDASARATSGGEVKTRLAAIDNVLSGRRLAHLSKGEKNAWAIKVIRVNILSGVLGGTPLSAEDREALASTVDRLLWFAPRALEVLSQADRDTLTHALIGVEQPSEPRNASLAQKLHRARQSLPRKPWYALHRESNLRRVVVTKAHNLFT